MRACVPQAFSIDDANYIIKITSLSLPVSCVYLSLFFCYSLDQERIYSLNFSSSLPSKIEHVRYPIKPRTMAQAPIPSEESILDISSDNDVTIVQKCKTNL